MPKYINADEMKTVKSIQSADFNSIETIRQWIDSQPTADVVEVKHGYWEERFEYQHEKFCSKCGLPQLWMNAVVYNYCPVCGADMRKRSETK